MSIRVLAVIDSLGQGGAERSLVESFGALPQHDRHIAVFRRVDEGFEETAREYGITLHFLPGRLHQRVRGLRRLVDDLQPDVVHSSLWNADLTARLAALGTRTALVTSLVSDTYSQRRLSALPLRQRALVRWFQLVDRVTSRRVTVFHAITQAVADHYEVALGLDSTRIVVAWRGRSIDRFRPPTEAERTAVRSQLGLDFPTVLSVARLEPQKGHRYLLRAITQIRATFPELTVVAIGREGNASAALRKEAAELGVDTHVRWEGHRDDVVRYLWAADLLVLSSTNEGLGGVVIEAMLTETPVVASNLPGIQEISLDGEFVTLVPAAEPERLAEAIRATLDEKEALRDRAARALAHAQESFSIEAAAQNLSEIYDRAIVEAP